MPFELGTAIVKVVAAFDKKQVAGEAKAAGDAGAASIQASLAKAFTPGVALKAFGTAVSGMFAIATGRALELEKAQGKFRAATGATAEEAKRAGEVINRMAGSNLQSIEEITDAMISVRTNLGLTGKDLEDTTQDFLTFARATGQDAAGAVSAFDDILDGFNLDASASRGIMDQLIASTQKYGGTVPAMQSALAALAPSLQAMNLGVDDGIGLLNLFATSGIDAGDAAGLLQRSIKALKPGQDLNDLVAQLGAIEDPTLRAQKAIELFGKSGAKIANAIEPGTTSIDGFIVRAEDVVGATDKARAALDDTFGAKAELLLRNFGSTVTEVLGKGGPMITALASIGSLAGTFGLDKALRKAAGSAPVKAAAAAAATAIGAVFGTAMGAAETLSSKLADGIAALGRHRAILDSAGGAGRLVGLAFGAGLVLGLAAIAPDLARQAAELGNTIHDQIFTGPLEGIGNALEDVGRNWQQLRNDLEWPLGQKNAPDWARLSGETATGGEQVGAGFIVGWTRGMGDPWGNAAGGGRSRGGSWAALVPPSEPLHSQAFALGRDAADWAAMGLSNLGPAAKRISVEALQKMADGITSARQIPLDAFTQLIEAMKKPLTQTAETSRLIGELASKELARGLSSGDPAIRAQARATREAIIERLQEIEPGAGTVSKKAMDQLAAGMKSKDPVVRAAATEIYEAIQEKLELAADARRWAAATAEAYAQTLAAHKERLTAAMQTALGGVLDILETHSPPSKGPLKDIQKWAAATGLAWVDAFVEEFKAAPGKLKVTLAGVQVAFEEFVKNYSPIGTLFGGLTPEADRANLVKYIANLRASLPGETDPAKRREILQEILEYEQRLAALQGKTATASQKTAETLQTYINNLDKALLTTTDPKRIKAITDQLLIYLARLDAILNPKTAADAAVAVMTGSLSRGTGAPPPPSDIDRRANPAFTPSRAAAAPVVTPVAPGGVTVTGPDPRLQGTNGYIDENGTLIFSEKPTVTNNITVNNPKQETASRSTESALLLVASGVTG